MTEEEKAELAELAAKEKLTEEEKARKAELEGKPLNPEDEFDTAFDEAMGEETSAGTDTKTAAEVEAEAKVLEEAEKKRKKEEKEADEAKLAQEGDSIFNGVPGEEDLDNAGGEGETPEQTIARIEADLAAEKQRNSSWEGRIKAANKRADEAEVSAAGKKNLTDKGDETLPDGEDDDSVLTDFIEEFPSLEKPIKLLATKIARELVESKMDEITPTLKTVQETVESNAVNDHLGKITKAHPDWRQIHKSGALGTWIGKQPQFMQAGLKRVVDEGSAEDIVELFTTYKKSTGQLKTETNSGKGKTSAQKAKELEAVAHQSSGPPKDTKKIADDDFDSAWDNAISTK